MEVSESAKKLRAPLWVRCLVSLSGIVCTSIALVGVLMSSSPPLIWMEFVAAGTALLVLWVPNIAYARPNAMVSTTCITLAAWTAILSVASPIFTEQYYRAEAWRLISAYPNATLVQSTYSFHGFDSVRRVRYLFRVKHVSGDFSEMQKIYMAELGMKGYIVDEKYSTAAIIVFRKADETAPHVSVSNESDQAGIIEVDVYHP